MTSPKNTAAKPTGRPIVAAYDHASKNCEHCDRQFYLRERRFQSFKKFQKRRFCSVDCALGGRRSALRGDHKTWILENIAITSAGCWEWTGPKTAKGYGSASVNGVKVRAHRYAYQTWKGDIPAGMMVLHSCDNRPCCNPDHLRVGSAMDNFLDAVSRNRMKASKAAPLIPNSDLFGATLKNIAERYGVCVTTVWRQRQKAQAA